MDGERVRTSVKDLILKYGAMKKQERKSTCSVQKYKAQKHEIDIEFYFSRSATDATQGLSASESRVRSVMLVSALPSNTAARTRISQPYLHIIFPHSKPVQDPDQLQIASLALVIKRGLLT